MNLFAFVPAQIRSQRNPDNETERGRFHSRFMYGDLEGTFHDKKAH
jgi:hypothetical protein